MTNHSMRSPLLSFILVLLASMSLNCHGASERKTYIVYMGAQSNNVDVVSTLHNEMLTNVLESDSSVSDSLVYTYGKSFNGFAARLTSAEVARISEMDGVVSVFQNKNLQLHTTKSWDFMGLTLNDTLQVAGEGDVIVGVLDTGIWPESKSFSDDGLGPPPAKWKGTCNAENFTCNNKIIGARFYNSHNFYNPEDIKSPRDTEGHGSHTSSTVAGRPVSNASYLGLAKGVARGAVPNARIAVYKVCWSSGCGLADILAAFDDAIADGVDVISVSLGEGGSIQYFEDPIAIGSFHAMKNGILTSNSAGNSGPYPMTVANYAPWSLTVAASSINRKFVAQVVLGNGKTFTGNAINSFKLHGSEYSLIYGGDAVNVSAGSNSEISGYCVDGAMNSAKVEGKIVLCDGMSSGSGILLANGLGSIMGTSDFADLAFSFSLPATIISPEDSAQILDYIRSTSNPIGTILSSDEWEDILAPVVVSFSSRGPNPITPDILKPDLTAPGVDILAAWSPLAGPSVDFNDKRSVDFNIISGTSMSCPHVTGAAAFLKSVHPSWSPSAIKSALMTTAKVMDPRTNEDAEFAYGSGHIDPLKALYPGLVFDASEQDYIDFLCNQGYNTSTLRLVTGGNTHCATYDIGKAWDLNYPSFALSVADGQFAMATFHRTVTNVGSPNSTYHVDIFAPSSLKVTVKPSTLPFSYTGEKKSFTVTVSTGVLFQQPIISASITWFDGRHTVRTPLVVYTVLPSSPTLGAEGFRSFTGKANRPLKSGLLNRD